MKRFLPLNHIFLISSALLLISGCGSNNNPISTTFSTSALIVAKRDLTIQERTIATRICYAYQSKNTSFKSQTYYGATFNFNMSFKECNNNTSNYTVSGVLTASPTTENLLIYSTTNTARFNKKVQTAQTGFLAQLCQKIQNNIPISNTVINNDSTVQIAFSSGSMDSYTLQYFTKINNVSKISSAETFKVRTQFNITANQILGMDESYSRQQVCSDDSSKFTELNQVFLNFTPK